MTKSLGRKAALALLTGLVSTLCTLAISVPVSKVHELRAVELGYPVAFLEQDMRRYSPLSTDFPVRLNFEAPWNAPTRMRWGALAFDVTVHAALFFGAFIAVRLRG